jgi:hypothetical protein
LVVHRFASTTDRFIDGSVFDGLWWKDRRLKPGEDGSGTEKEKLTYEKPYDHYFCEPDDFWEQKYVLLPPRGGCVV